MHLQHRKPTRFLAVVLVIFLCLFDFAGCSSSVDHSREDAGEEGSSEAAETDSSYDVSMPPEEKVVQLWLYGPGKQKDSDEVLEQFNELLAQYVPYTKVELTVMPAVEYKEKFGQMLASAEPVDLTWISDWVTGVTNQIEDGNLMPLDDLIDQYGPFIREDLDEKILDIDRYSDGKLYYIICYQGLCTGKRALWVPTQLAQLAGDTWIEDTQQAVDKWWNDYEGLEDFQKVFDQFGLYFQAAKDAGRLYAGCECAHFLGWNYRNHLETHENTNLRNCGIVHGDDTFTVIDAIDTPYYRLFAKNLAEYFKKGYIRQDIASIDSSLLHYVKNGVFDENTCIIYMHNCYLEEDEKKIQDRESGMDTTFFPVERNVSYSNGEVTATAIPYCADEPEAAMRVLNAIFEHPDLYNLLIYGIEGKHYENKGDGMIITPYTGMPTVDDDYGLYRWVIGDCRFSFVTQSDSAGVYDRYKEAEKTAYVSPFIKFHYQTTECSDILAALKAVDDEYTDILASGCMGDSWEKYYNEWVAARKAAGADQLVEIMQEQIDAYMKANKITSW